MKELKFKLEGVTPLMLNNPQTVNPFNEFAKAQKELTAKRKKTEDDMMELFKLKFLSSLYVNTKGQYYIPAEHIENALIQASKERKLGAKFTRSMQVLTDPLLEFADSDKTPEQLYEIGTYVDVRAVAIMRAKVPTARAIIPQWSLKVSVLYDETQIDTADIVACMEVAGLRYGIGTYRKKFGKFSAKTLK
jgi:hypothetical protein